MPQPLADWLGSFSALEAVGWVAGVVAVIAFFWKGWPVLKKIAYGLMHFVEMGDAIAGLPAFIARTDRTLADQTETLAVQDVKIESIHHETHTNNGSSIKDAQKRTEEAVERIELGVKGLYDEVDKLQAADEKLAHDLEDTMPRSRFEPPRTE